MLKIFQHFQKINLFFTYFETFNMYKQTRKQKQQNVILDSDLESNFKDSKKCTLTEFEERIENTQINSKCILKTVLN